MTEKMNCKYHLKVHHKSILSKITRKASKKASYKAKNMQNLYLIIPMIWRNTKKMNLRIKMSELKKNLKESHLSKNKTSSIYKP